MNSTLPLRQPLPSFHPPRFEQKPVVTAGGVDRVLLGSAAGLATLGLVMVFGASFFWGEDRLGDPWAMASRQTLLMCLAGVAGWTLSHVPQSVLRRFAYPFLAVVLVLLALVLIPGIGQVRGGARRWISLGITFEPTE
jgi:cell division protein FtsW